MSELQRLRDIQYKGTAVFAFNFNDTMDDINGDARDFGSLAGGSVAATIYTFKVAGMPKGAVVTGGSLSRSVAFDTAGLDVTVGDTASTNRYVASTDVKGTGVTALVPTGYVSDGEDLVITLSTDDACTTGKAVLEVEYVRPGFVSEVAL
jgi:hypothetical protein